MTYQEQYLNSKRLFSPTFQNRFEYPAQDTKVWRMVTFQTAHGHLVHHSSNEEVA